MNITIMGLRILILLLFASTALAADLVCDPQADVTHYDVVVDGAVVAASYAAESDGSIRYNIDQFADGVRREFVLIAIDASGWRSQSSVPLNAKKPVGSSNVRIEQ